MTYDLEDSVTEATKPAARKALQEHLASLPSQAQQPAFNEVAVRINAVSTRHALDDIRAVAAFPALQALVIPKVNSAADLALVDDAIRAAAPHRATPLRLLALVESARAVMDLRAICDAGASRHLRGLIFAAEDFARDLSLTRTVPMTEMLYARSAVVTAARAFELESAIDVVCTVTPGVPGNPRLVDECEQGRGMGFNGKRAYPITLVFFSSLVLSLIGGEGARVNPLPLLAPFPVSGGFVYVEWGGKMKQKAKTDMVCSQSVYIPHKSRRFSDTFRRVNQRLTGLLVS